MEKQSLFLKSGLEKPDSAVTICEMSVCVGVHECARACICGLSLSYPHSPECGAAALLHERERKTIDGNNEREREREAGRQASRQTKTEGERQSDSKGSRGWWLPWGAMSGWRRVSERDGGRVIEGAREAAM